jgi:hypothetical protein
VPRRLLALEVPDGTIDQRMTFPEGVFELRGKGSKEGDI